LAKSRPVENGVTKRYTRTFEGTSRDASVEKKLKIGDVFLPEPGSNGEVSTVDPP
jgi:hypothetical protein